MSIQLPRRNSQPYLVVAPDGDRVEIPRELFLALYDFLLGSKASGSVTIHFRNGGVAGVEALVKKTYK
jgi:hypothetical protein